jgi:hypothetical protein
VNFRTANDYPPLRGNLLCGSRSASRGSWCVVKVRERESARSKITCTRMNWRQDLSDIIGPRPVDRSWRDDFLFAMQQGMHLLGENPQDHPHRNPVEDFQALHNSLGWYKSKGAPNPPKAFPRAFSPARPPTLLLLRPNQREVPLPFPRPPSSWFIARL